MKTMTYRGYAARIEYSDEDQCLVGHIAGINDVVGFHGLSVTELRAAFESSSFARSTTSNRRQDEAASCPAPHSNPLLTNPPRRDAAGGIPTAHG